MVFRLRTKHCQHSFFFRSHFPCIFFIFTNFQCVNCLYNLCIFTNIFQTNDLDQSRFVP